MADYISCNNFDALLGESSEALAKEAFQRMHSTWTYPCALQVYWRAGV